MRNKIVTIQDVAKAAHVSSATVSRVLNNSSSVTSKTTDHVKQVMADLGYRPNILARGLRVSATKTIGVIITNVLNSFFTKIVRGIEDAVALSGYSVIICNTDESKQKEIDYIRNLVDRKVDGLIIASSGSVNNYTELLKGVPTVFIDRVPNKAEADKFDSVIVDNKMGAYQLTQQLIDDGKRHIGMIASDVVTTGLDRIRGFQLAAKDNNIPSADVPVEVADYLGKNTVDLAQKLSDEHVDAIFAGNNIILLSVLQALNEKKQLNTITVAVFDQTDWLPFIKLPYVAVNQPVTRIVKCASSILLKRMKGEVFTPKKIILPITIMSQH